MALSEDKKAMLRLLSQGGQGYGDIAALMGLSVEEVHARVREAVAELEAEGIPAPSIPPPPEGAPAARPEAPPVPAPRDEPVPTAKARPAPEAEPSGPAPARPPRARPPRGLPRQREVRIGLAVAGAAVLVVLLILLLGGGGSGDTNASAPSAGAEKTAATEGKEVTKAVLGSVDGSEASGVAIFGRVKNRLALQVAASGLQPTGKGDAYTVWLAASPQRMLPLASTKVAKAGRINAQVEVPTEVLAYLADETFDQIAVTRTSRAKLQASLEEATSRKEAPTYTGTPVLRGAVTGPIVGAAKE